MLPSAFEAHRDLLADAVRTFAPAPLVLEVDGDAWTLADDDGTIRVRAGTADDAETVLRLSAAQLNDLVSDQVTVVGMQTNGSLDQPVGRFDALLDWWLLLRGALDGRAPHTPGAIDLVDASGAPLALDRSFTGRRTARRDGRLPPARRLPPHRQTCSTEEEMAAVSRDMDAAAPLYSRGDGRSWWARNRRG